MYILKVYNLIDFISFFQNLSEKILNFTKLLLTFINIFWYYFFPWILLMFRGTILQYYNKPWARNIADFPLPAVPDPLPPGRLNMGAFFSMSGNMRNLIFEPRMYTFSSCPTWPSRYVTVIFCIWQFILSSASMSLPRYTSPVFVSQVMIWPSASWSTLIGTPIDIMTNQEYFSLEKRRISLLNFCFLIPERALMLLLPYKTCWKLKSIFGYEAGCFRVLTGGMNWVLGQYIEKNRFSLKDRLFSRTFKFDL